MKSQSPEGTSMHNDRLALLRTIVADPQTTNPEREAARAELSEPARENATHQQTIDHELHSWLFSNRHVDSFVRIEERRGFCQASKALLDDIFCANNGGRCDSHAIDRLTRLAANTESIQVREAATEALSSIAFFQERRSRGL
jgi:hypothetical protein